MTNFLNKATELKRAYYVENPNRISATLDIKNNDKYCFFCSILPYLIPTAYTKSG